MALESLLIQDIKTQILQYLYRSCTETVDPTILLFQEISRIGQLNWHVDANKEKLASVFTQVAHQISIYSTRDGEFRFYVLNAFVNILFTVYMEELVRTFVDNGYNVTAESVLASINDAYTLAPPQNTNFPRVENTSNKVNPSPVSPRLVASTLYTTPLE